MQAEDMQVRSDVVGIISTVLEIQEGAVQSASTLRELPGIESIKVLRIITKIEARYGIELDEQVVFNVVGLDELVNEVSALRAASLRAQAVAQG